MKRLVHVTFNMIHNMHTGKKLKPAEWHRACDWTFVSPLDTKTLFFFDMPQKSITCKRCAVLFDEALEARKGP